MESVGIQKSSGKKWGACSLHELNLSEPEQMITTVEIAEAIGVTHKNILQKLEGTDRLCKGKRVHTDGIIEVLARLNFQPSDFFIQSSYCDSSGKENKCYQCTRKGCEFLAHKFSGEKGILFTAMYINRFHDMENRIKQEVEQIPETRKPIYKYEWDRIEAEIFANWSNPPLLPPPRKTWYERNRMKIKSICGYYGWGRKYLYHKILTELGTRYDLERAKRVYTAENGFTPYYTMDIVEYFPQLQDVADKYINYLLEG